MTAYVTIPVATVQNALKLPNTALRYKPPMTPAEILALYKQYGIEGGERTQASADTAMAAQNATPPGAGEQNPPRAPKMDSAVVWKLHPGNSMEPVKVSLGITDHAFTEVSAVLKGQLKEGDEVVIRSIVSQSQAPGGIRR
jgi:HlyD family secretion protein